MATAAQLRADHDRCIQHAKIVVGTYGSADITIAGQTTSANSIPIVIASDQSNLPIFHKPATTGGCSIFYRIATADTNSAVIKGSAGTIYSAYVHNGNVAVRVFKLYNKATGPTVGTDTPIFTMRIPATSGVSAAFGGGLGLSCSAGIGMGMTQLSADNDTTAVSASDMIAVVTYF